MNMCTAQQSSSQYLYNGVHSFYPEGNAHSNKVISSEANLIDSKTLEKLENLLAFLKEINEKLYNGTLRSIVQECVEKGPKHLLQIKTLDLTSCELTSLPSEIGVLTNLRSLNLIDNQLKTLPPELFNLATDLRSLRIEDNQFKELPKVVYEISIHRIQNKKYMELYLRGNPMDVIPEEIKPIVCSLPHCGSLFSSWKGDFPHIFSS